VRQATVVFLVQHPGDALVKARVELALVICPPLGHHNVFQWAVENGCDFDANEFRVAICSAGCTAQMRSWARAQLNRVHC